MHLQRAVPVLCVMQFSTLRVLLGSLFCTQHPDIPLLGLILPFYLSTKNNSVHSVSNTSVVLSWGVREADVGSVGVGSNFLFSVCSARAGVCCRFETVCGRSN